MLIKRLLILPIAVGAVVVGLGGNPSASASGGSGGGSQPVSTTPTTAAVVRVDTVKVSKAYTNANIAGGSELLIKAASSDSTAQLMAYRPDGTLIGEVQNGGGSKYGGTVMPAQSYDPVNITIVSSAGGTVTVPTTPFQL